MSCGVEYERVIKYVCVREREEWCKRVLYIKKKKAFKRGRGSERE